MKGKNLSRGLSKILSVLLTFVMIFSAMPPVAQAAVRTGDFYLRGNIGAGNFVIATQSGNTAIKSNLTGSSVAVDSHNIITTNPIPSDAIWEISSAGSSKYYIMSGTQYLISNNGTLALGSQAQADSTGNTSGKWTYSNNDFSVTYSSGGSQTRYLRYSSGFSLTSQSYFASAMYLYQGTELAVSSLAFVSHPTKLSYSEGDLFNPAGMSLTATYNDYSTDTVGPDDCTFSPSLTTPLTPSDSSVTINYGSKHVSQAITVAAKTVASIEITTPPSKTEYDEGETFSSSGMVVTAHYDNGTDAEVTGYSIAPSGALTPSDTSVTITYNGKTVTQSITVHALVLDHIAITSPPTKTAYIEDQVFDPAGMVVTAYFTNNSHAVITSYTYSPGTKLNTANTQITVSYNGMQAIQAITVAAKDLDHIAISTPPTKTTYVVGQTFNPAGMVVKAYYTNGLNETITGYSTDPTEPLVMGTTKVTLTFTYGSTLKSVEQSIAVIAKALDHITITTPPTKTAYVVGQTFETTGMVVTAYYNDDTNAVAADYTYSPTRTLVTTDTKVTISFGGKSADQTITVAVATNAETPNINAETPVDWLAVDIGATASLSVTANVSKGILSYQWYSNTAMINSGGTAIGTSSSDPSLTLNTAAAGTMFYYCVVTNTDTTATGSQTATATSRVAQVIVRRDAQTPTISSSSPANMSVYQNSSSSITVSAYIDSGVLTYQWYSDTTGLNSGGTPVGSSSSSPTLTLNTSTAGTTYYYCVVTNTDNAAPGVKTATATSRAARVVVSASGKGTLLLTFDDGWSDQYTQAYPILNGKGFKGTAYVNSDFIGSEYGYMSIGQAQALNNAGWDIANHTSTHEDTGVGDQIDQAHLAQLKTMYNDCANWLTSNGMPRAAYHVAYPSGLYSSDLIRLLKLNGFKTGRATMFGQQSGIEYQNDYFTLPVYSLGDTNDLAACLDGIDQAASTGTTLIIMIHKVEQYSGDLVTTTSWLQQVVNRAKTQVDANKLQVMTISEWYAAQGVVGSGQTPPVPNVTGNDDTNTVSGLSLVMEYKMDSASGYTMYDPATFPTSLAGDHTLAVRYAASGADPAGPDKVLTFTKVLKSIAITTPPTKTVYVEGNMFDQADMVVTATYDDGTTAAVTGYTIDKTGELSITDTKVIVSYTFAGITKTADQSITVNAKKLSSVGITAEPTKKNYVEGTPFDPAGMEVTAYYDNGKSEVITDYTIAPSRELVVTDTKVTVSYTYASLTKTADQTITVSEKALSSIAITAPPKKTIYIEGNDFDRTDMVVTAYYNNGKSEAVTGYTISPSAGLATTDKKVTISYTYNGLEKTTDQAITVNGKSLDHIAVTTEPFKKVYVEGNAFNSTGMVVTAYYDNGTNENVYGYSVAPLRALVTADTKVTISYTYKDLTKTVDQTITVNAKSLVRIEITTPPTKTAYIEGDTFNSSGMIVTAYYDNDTSAVITGYSVTPSGVLTVSDVRVTVSYTYVGETKTAELPITVSSKSLSKILITSPPANNQYIEGQKFDATGMVVTAYYDNGNSEEITGYKIVPSGELSTTDTKVTVSYTYADVTENVNLPITVVSKSLNHIAITTEPTKKAYVEGTLFDPTGMEVTAYYDNGTNTSVTGYSIIPPGELAIADTKVTVNYGGKTAEQEITVVAKSLDHIAITTAPDKTEYIVGQKFDATDMVVTAYYDNEKHETVTGYTIAPSGELATTDTKVTVSFTYAGVTKAADQVITVIAKSITRLDFKTHPTTTQYLEGKTFNPAGMVLTATYNDDSSEDVLPSDCTFSINRPLKATDKSINVIYDSLYVTQDITVFTRAQLKGITATAGTLSPKFDPNIKIYTLNLDEHTSSTKIKPVLADASSKLYINGKRVSSKTITLATGKNTKVSIKVQPKSGKSLTYTVTVRRAPSTNANLSYLKSSRGTITKVDSTNYTVNLSTTQTSTTFSLKLKDRYAKYSMTLDGKKTTSKTVSIKPGTTRTLVITVTPQAGSAYAVVYTVTIVRSISHNNNLASLKTSRGTLKPTFDPAVTEYTIALSSKYSSTTLTIKTAASTAKYTITIGGKKSSSIISVSKGKAKTVTITVTSQAGETKIYTVTITRAS